MKIIGLDPGLRFTGWGVIEAYCGRECSYVKHGVISVPISLSLPERLKYIFFELKELINSTDIDEVAVEEIFVNNNGKSTMKLCMARGVVVLVPKLCNKEIFEYTANKIKKTVVGYGHASKDEIKKMLKYTLLNFKEDKNEKSDGTDALAVALCHAQHRQVLDLVS
ncbi:MAG: crossover junction endodeoxyribonuclease RuvC [Holosporales bacterium]|nr:crossover junction endodeoxyribonuclease RuvC [Holosporales bacterium]